jgi:hypothetical protein
MTVPIALTYQARLAAPDRTARPQGRSEHRSWFITFGFGKPAECTFTEVVLPDFADDGTPLTQAVKDELVRRLANDLYGTAWAFHYRPDQAAEALWRYDVRLREHVTVTSVEVWA